MSGAGVPLVFPPSRTCLWDSHATGDALQVSVDGNCWVCIRVSQSVLQLAVRASCQSNLTPLDCLLLGSAFVSEKGGVVVEVDRFDMGRSSDPCLQPTAFVPGDVVIYCTVGPEETVPCSDSVAVAALNRTLESPLVSLQPSSLLHLQVHITVHHSESTHHSNLSLSLSCQCVHPCSCTLIPICDVPIMHTALARNLAGPLSLPILQDTVKWGYLTMEITRKLVLLLNSDPNSLRVPLVGVWVSGISGVAHPAVWASVLHYKHCCMLGERVGGVSLCLVYSTNHTHPFLFEFKSHGINDQEFIRCSAHTDVQLCTGAPPLSLELLPFQSSVSVTKLRTALIKDRQIGVTEFHMINSSDWPQSREQLLASVQRSTVPLPSPLPTLARDSQLSCVSLMNKDRNTSSHSSLSSSALLSGHTLVGSKHSGGVVVPYAPHKPTTNTSLSATFPSVQLTVFPEKQKEPPTFQCTENVLRKQELQVSELLAVHKTPTVERGTNTGESLLQFNVPGRVTSVPGEVTTVPGDATSVPARVIAIHGDDTGIPGEVTTVHGEVTTIPGDAINGVSVATSLCGEVSNDTTIPGEVSVATSVPGEISVATEASIQPISLDLCSFAPSSTCSMQGRSTTDCIVRGEWNMVVSESARKSTGFIRGDDAGLLHSNRQRFYQNMLAQVQELLQTSPTDRSLTLQRAPRDDAQPSPIISPKIGPSMCHKEGDESFFPVPHILNAGPLYMESTLDEANDAADMIAMKYIGQTPEADGPLSDAASRLSYVDNQMTIATDNYMRRHRLLPHQEATQILDVDRLRTLPKLI